MKRCAGHNRLLTLAALSRHREEADCKHLLARVFVERALTRAVLNPPT
jgi:hypothetical protein